jgi:transposase
MDEMITISRSEYEGMKREIAELRMLVQRLMEEISLLKGGKSSRTSSTSPSHDIGRSNSLSLRVSSGKKPGGQLGHTGSTLSMSDTPDQIIDHQPLVCEHCGEDLQTVVSHSFTRRQLVDIPPIAPIYIEHRSHIKICPLCQFQNRGLFPEDLRAPVQYGTHIEAMAGYLSVYQSLPYKRISQLFKDFFGLRPSEGSVDTFLENLSRKSDPVYASIGERIGQSEVVGSDETGCRVNGKKHWFHVWQTCLLTFIVSFASRGHKVIEEYFPGGFIRSFYVSDCWSSQLKVTARAHQLCMAHLLRELTNFAENLKREWSLRMKDLFLRAIELKNKMTQDDYLNLPEEVTKLNAELDVLLKTDCSKFHDKEQAFIKRLNKHRQSIFTFLTHPDVPPDNNASERAIRNVKVKTKVSGQFRNKDGKGADRYAKIRSVIDTTIKNGQDVFAALVCLANCKVMKPIPE